ncbi:hypothetical protein [Viscerimonas tarda]
MNFRFIWGAFMAVAYIGIAYLVVFTPVLIRYNANDNKSANDEYFIVRIILGLVLFAYGLFRGYRIWKMKQN